MKPIQACALIAILFLAFSVASVSASANSAFGGKSGDWIEYEYQEAMLVEGGQSPNEWVRLDFLNVDGANVTVNATLYTSISTIISETATIDLTSQNAQDDIMLEPMFNARVYFIPADLNVSDPVYLGQVFGTQNITGETTLSYVGVDRTVVFTNFTFQGSKYSLLWDRQTGVLTEGLKYNGGVYDDVLVTDTNMWSPPILWPILVWVAIALAVILGVVSSRKSFSKKAQKKGNSKTTSTKTHSILYQEYLKRKGY